MARRTGHRPVTALMVLVLVAIELSLILMAITAELDNPPMVALDPAVADPWGGMQPGRAHCLPRGAP